MMNQVILQGRLARTPELNHTNKGKPVVTVPLACERDVRAGEDGKRETDFFEIVAWDSKAEFLCAYFEKGQAVNVIGRLKNRRWIDRTGVEQKGCEIVLDRIYSITPRIYNDTPKVETENSTENADEDEPDRGERERECETIKSKDDASELECQTNVPKKENIKEAHKETSEEVSEDKQVPTEPERRFRLHSIERE